MGAMTGARTTRRPRKRVVALVVVLGLVAGAAWAVLHAGDPFATGTKRYAANGIAFAYPAGWLVNEMLPASSGLGQTFALIGTQAWGLCLPLDSNCHDDQKLDASQISVKLTRGILGGTTICDRAVDRSDLAGRGPGDPPATGHLVRVDGRPTLQIDYAVNGTDYYRSDAWRTWVIAAPGSTQQVYWIEAMYRGPGDELFHQQLDDLVAGIRFDGAPPAGDGQTDCGAPFPSPTG